MARPWGRRIAVGGSFVTAIVILPPAGLTALAWVGGVALGLWAMVAALRGRRTGRGSARGRSPALPAGLVLAIALGFAVIWGVLEVRERKRLLVGTAAGLSPFLVHIALAGPGHAFFGMVIQPVFQLRGGRRLPVPPSWSHFDGFLQRAGELNALQWPISWPPRPSQLTLWLALLVASSMLLAIVGWQVRRRSPATTAGVAVLVMGAFSVGLLPQALQRPDSTHLAWVSAVPFGLLPVAIAELLRARRPSLRPSSRLLIAASTPAVLLFVLVPHFTFGPYSDVVAQTFDRRREVYVMENDGRSFYYGRRDAAEAVNAMLPVVDQIARPGDKLFVGTGDLRKTPYSEAFLYYLLPERGPGRATSRWTPGWRTATTQDWPTTSPRRIS